MQVPLIISVPGMRDAGARTDAIVELIDLYPTFAEMSGIGDQPPSILQGDSLVPLLISPTDTDTNATAYTLTSAGGASLRTERWRYNRWGDEAEGENEELYDHDEDPAEHQNLASDPTYATVLEEIRAQFDAVRRNARDAASSN